MRAMDEAALRAKIRDIKDFPTEGILFKDITTLLKDGPAWRYAVDSLASRYQAERVDVVVGVESRGFIFGGAIAHQLQAGFVPVRKLGKLPAKTIEVEYELEYGRDALAMHEDAIARLVCSVRKGDLWAVLVEAAPLLGLLVDDPVEARLPRLTGRR